MRGKRISLAILTAFLLGTLILIYVHYIFTKNNDALIKGNEQLMGEVMVNSQLKDLEKFIVTMESIVKGTVVTNDATYFSDLQKNIDETENSLKQLQGITDDDSSAMYIDELDTLVRHKLLYDKNVLDVFKVSGKKAAEEMLSSRYGVSLTDSIVSTVHKIDSSRKKYYADATVAIEKSSKKAQRFITILILSVLLGGAFLFWYIINTIRRQSQLINQLNISERKANDAVRIKENFLANMSHEIRTPMNAILGFTSLLQRKELDDESKEYVKTIESSGENLLAIINDILDLSKIEAGMVRIEEAPFSVRGMLHSIEVLFKNKISEKNLEFKTFVYQDIPDILIGDNIRLTQILVNLISNAIKFTSQGYISVRMYGERSDTEKFNLRVDIEDTGIGIKKVMQDAVFERFRQAEDSTTRKYGGTGLGLSIVKDLILLQHGNIAVESEDGTGTVFTFNIPYKISGDQYGFEAEESEKNTKTFINKSVRILVAEDNEINQKLLIHLFNDWGIQYSIAQNGLECLEKLKQENYNLVLMDIQMPEMDGYKTTQEIRKKLKLDIPIIAMTAHAMAGEREKCLSYGMNEHLSKPVREKDLVYAISKFINLDIHTTEAVVEIPYGNDAAYKIINLDYMKEISKGNAEYEKAVTEQFIEMVPEAVALLKRNFETGNYKEMADTAHNLKTSISVMGLNEKLNSHIDYIETEQADKNKLESEIRHIERICKNALQEAAILLKSLQ